MIEDDYFISISFDYAMVPILGLVSIYIRSVVDSYYCDTLDVVKRESEGACRRSH
jgi:hypothetical protein